MRRKNDTLASKVNRMCEFYEPFDLCIFDDFIGQGMHDVDECWTFLDMQTRCDYVSCQGAKDPSIHDYIIKLNQHFNNKYGRGTSNGNK